ncbi:MAG: hypothetical protein Aurels2KO_22760 [Aureliella sp.]
MGFATSWNADAPLFNRQYVVAEFILLAVPWYLGNRNLLALSFLGGVTFSVPITLNEVIAKRYSLLDNWSEYDNTFLTSFFFGTYAYFLIACVRRTTAHLMTKGFQR